MLKNVRMFASVSLVVVCLVGCGTLASKRNMYSGEVSNAAVIRSSGTVMVGAIDNKSVGVSFIGQVKEYGVLPGEHTLLVEYSDYWSPDFGDDEKVTSRPVKLTFVAKPNQQYQITHKKIPSLKESRVFAETPSFDIQNVTTNTRVEHSMELSEPKGLLPSIAFESSPEYTFKNTEPVEVEGVEGVDVNSYASEREALVVLQRIWSESSASTRTKFLQWITSK